MRRVLVTGATGFIGQSLVKHLVSQGCQVRALVRDPVKAAKLPAEVECCYGSLEQSTSLATACKNIDTVFHLAGHAHAWAERDVVASQKHQAVNLEGTQTLLAAAKDAHVQRLVYFSTIKAVADSLDEIDEDFDVPPQSAYGLAKRKAELAVLQSSLMHVCVLRPTLVYGPGLKGNLAAMLKAIDKGYFLPLPEVRNRRSMVGIDDLCRAAILAATTAAAHGRVYIVSDGVPYSTRSLYDLMRQSLNLAPRTWSIPLWLLTGLARLGDMFGMCIKRRCVFDSQALAKLLGSASYRSIRIEQDLGFKAKDTLNQLLPAIVLHYRGQKS